jgi:hypothetical protein
MKLLFLRDDLPQTIVNYSVNILLKESPALSVDVLTVQLTILLGDLTLVNILLTLLLTCVLTDLSSDSQQI